jgi:signal transduction histidine kinase
MKANTALDTTAHKSRTCFGFIEGLSNSEQLVSALFSTPNVGMAVYDDQLRYQMINATLARFNGIPPQHHLGKRIGELLGDLADEVEPLLRRVIATNEPLFNFEVAARLPSRSEVGHWVANYFPIKNPAGTVSQVGVLVVEVTQQKKLEKSLRILTRKLLRTQDEEQRRIARDLHDSINQYHVALKLNLLRLRRNALNGTKRNGLLAESIELLDHCMAETRTISHLLHPPLLDEMGFASATRWYVKGFAQRSGIKVNLNLVSEPERLPGAIEIALFRVLQETITNVHRHAQTSQLDIDIRHTQRGIVMQVRDYGVGIPAKRLRYLREATGVGGVGIASMRERLHELGGALQITSGSNGTTVRAQVPLPMVRHHSLGEARAAAASA